MGNMYEYKHRNEVHFAVTKRADLNKLVTMKGSPFDPYYVGRKEGPPFLGGLSLKGKALLFPFPKKSAALLSFSL
jgi:hypothetical protein